MFVPTKLLPQNFKMKFLLDSSVSQSIRLNYWRHWDSFKTFVQTAGITYKLPFHHNDIALYVTYLWRSGLRTSTIKSHMSAISCVHKVNNLQGPCSFMYIYQRNWCQNVSRPRLRPISKTLLQDMLSILPQVIFQQLRLRSVPGTPHNFILLLASRGSCSV